MKATFYEEIFLNFLRAIIRKYFAYTEGTTLNVLRNVAFFCLKVLFYLLASQ